MTARQLSLGLRNKAPNHAECFPSICPNRTRLPAIDMRCVTVSWALFETNKGPGIVGCSMLEVLQAQWEVRGVPIYGGLLWGRKAKSKDRRFGTPALASY